MLVTIKENEMLNSTLNTTTAPSGVNSGLEQPVFPRRFFCARSSIRRAGAMSHNVARSEFDSRRAQLSKESSSMQRKYVHGHSGCEAMLYRTPGLQSFKTYTLTLDCKVRFFFGGLVGLGIVLVQGLGIGLVGR